MSKTWPPRRRPLTFRVFFFLDTAANDRLLFDFPHNVAGLFIVSQSDKGRVPQVTVWRPLGKLYLRNQLRFSKRNFSFLLLSKPIGCVSFPADLQMGKHRFLSR
jgi:hypothetical protein